MAQARAHKVVEMVMDKLTLVEKEIVVQREVQLMQQEWVNHLQAHGTSNQNNLRSNVCNDHHTPGQCPHANLECHICGEKGHIHRNCHRKGQFGGQQGLITRGRKDK